MLYLFFFFQAEDGIRDLVRSRGLGDVYKRQVDQSMRLTAALTALDPELWKERGCHKATRAYRGKLSLIHI